MPDHAKLPEWIQELEEAQISGGFTRCPSRSRDVYPVYNLEDLSIAGLPAGDRPRRYTGERAHAVQDARFAERCEAAGEEVRFPTDAERRELHADLQLEHLIGLTQAEAQHAGVPLRVDFDQPGLPEATFSLDLGAPVVSVPPSAAFPHAEARTSSVLRALTHANLHRDLAEACRPVQVLESVVGTEAPLVLVVRQPDSETLQRLRAYEADAPTSLDRHHLDMADLAVDCAALQRLTALGVTYYPSADADLPEKVERQAAELERPGAMARLSEVVASLERRAAPPSGAADLPERARERGSWPQPPPGGDDGDPGQGAPDRVQPRPSEQLPRAPGPSRVRYELPGLDGPAVEPRPLKASGAAAPVNPAPSSEPLPVSVRPSPASLPAPSDRSGIDPWPRPLDSLPGRLPEALLREPRGLWNPRGAESPNRVSPSPVSPLVPRGTVFAPIGPELRICHPR